MALEPLGFNQFRMGFFNAFGDDPARLRGFIVESLERIRQSFRTRIGGAIASARTLIANHEKEQVQELGRRLA